MTSTTTVGTGSATGLLTPAEVAALYRVATRTVTRWADSGRLLCVRTLGGHRRFPADQFADHVRALRTLQHGED